MTQSVSIEAIEQHTGRRWSEWVAYLDAAGARDLNHTEIARQAREGGAGDWWAQAVTVAYEQHIGRRQPGQDSSGVWYVTVTRSLEGDMDEALARWESLTDGQREFAGSSVVKNPEVSKTVKWRYWRAGLADGTRIVVTISDKAPGKAQIAVVHEKLAGQDALEPARAYWKTFIAGL